MYILYDVHIVRNEINTPWICLGTMMHVFDRDPGKLFPAGTSHCNNPLGKP